MPRPRRWTDDDLAAAVAASATLRDVCRTLQLTPGARTYESLRRAIAHLGLDASHLPALEAQPRGARRRGQWTDDDLVAAVDESRSLAQVLRRLGYEPNGGMHRYVRAHISRLGLDTSHFAGQGWSKGMTFPGRRLTLPLEEVLVPGSTYPTARLRERLIAAGIRPPHCEACGRSEWWGRSLPLQLDHINGDASDHRLENLRILCPNCHSLTDTWCGRNKGRVRSNV